MFINTPVNYSSIFSALFHFNKSNKIICIFIIYNANARKLSAETDSVSVKWKIAVEINCFDNQC